MAQFPPEFRWHTRWGHVGVWYDYCYDVGTLHVIDWYLSLCMQQMWVERNEIPRYRTTWPRHPSRYTDGEEEIEGIYR